MSGALRANSTLITLDLSGNNIKNSGAEAIAEALRANTVLISLDLSDNSINESVITKMQLILKANYGRMHACSCVPEEVTSLSEAVAAVVGSTCSSPSTMPPTPRFSPPIASANTPRQPRPPTPSSFTGTPPSPPLVPSPRSGSMPQQLTLTGSSTGTGFGFYQRSSGGRSGDEPAGEVATLRADLAEARDLLQKVTQQLQQLALENASLKEDAHESKLKFQVAQDLLRATAADNTELKKRLELLDAISMCAQEETPATTPLPAQ
eukprot:TRINITY_DN1785_c0_g1_i2.p3 TRINITY_DN1785_c0_g1~~TRINITY_DN1785_c0_g1_i2.p3  ORF type:complete len:265 (-),score=82.87 TRINITY_DN1785_c0_g1_i2:133-927(-)